MSERPVEGGDERRGLHRPSLVWGTLFLVVGVTYLVQALGAWRVQGEVLVPVLLIAAGLVVVIGGLVGARVSGGDR